MKNKRLISHVLVLLFIASSTMTSLGANVFSDVSSTHWAKDYIATMSEKGIISGSFDEKTLKFYFKPENAVTYVESVQMIYSTLKAVNQLENTTGVTDKYSAVLTNAKIPAWAHEAIAYAIEYKMIQVGDLQGFMKNGVQQNAKREDVAIFLGKAIDLKKEIKADSIIRPILSFVDGETVKDQAIPYVDWLVRKSIFTGDNENKFNPTKSIKRAEMATICFKGYELLKDVVIVNPVTPTPVTTVDTKIVSFILPSARMIIVKDDKNNEEVYTLETTGYVKKNGILGKIADVKVGDSVNLVFDSNKKLIGIDISNLVSEYEGAIGSLIEKNEYYLLTVKDGFDLNFSKEFKVYDNSDIRIDGKSVSVSSLKVGDRVLVNYIGEKATKVTLQLTEGTYSGLLETRVIFTTYPSIKIKSTNNQILEFVISDDAYVTRDGKRADLFDLNIGDVVEVRVKQNKIVDIDATSRNIKRTVEGAIKGIKIESPNKLVILPIGEREEITYEISNKAIITLDKKDAQFYDLRLGYNVVLTIESNMVTGIAAKKIELGTALTGQVIRVYEKSYVFTVNHLDPVTSNYEVLSIHVTDDTVIINKAGTVVRFGYLYTDDNVFVEGSYEGDIFVAKSIFIRN